MNRVKCENDILKADLATLMTTMPLFHQQIKVKPAENEVSREDNSFMKRNLNNTNVNKPWKRKSHKKLI